MEMRAAPLAWMLLLAGFLFFPPDRAPAESGHIPCAGFVIGNPNAPPSVEIRALPPPGASGTVSGVATNVDTSKVRISGWAHTDRYYPQPTLAEPFTCIGSDGSWSYLTHPWKRVIVLLVDDTYEIPTSPGGESRIDYHPSTDPGVPAWTEIPPSRTLSFRGEKWWVKDSAPAVTDPGPCIFSPSAKNVSVAADGRLHLKIVKQGTDWTCAEIVLDRSRGHGIYTFQVISSLNTLDFQDVFAGFLFESLTREIDIECSPVLTGLENGCQYVVRPPFDTNRRIFPMPRGRSTHRIVWSTDRIEFLSWRGLQPFPPKPSNIIQEWVYTGPDIPPPGKERMRLNLWLSDGKPPVGGRGSKVVVHSFSFCPLESC
jgi:hypothetical protein